ncbi:MAG: LysR family transcriptional regulator, partial [Pseudoclavibacter sp.]
MGLSPNALEYFCVVAEELHFGRAAERLRIAAPSLSQQIASLERQLGRRVFDRSPHHVRLTPTGEQLLPLALRLRAARAAVDEWARMLPSGGERTLRVGVVVSTTLASRILAEAARRLPNVSWEVVRMAFHEVGDRLKSGAADVAMSVSPNSNRRGLAVSHLATERRVLV